jgi:hypothetical protein
MEEAAVRDLVDGRVHGDGGTPGAILSLITADQYLVAIEKLQEEPAAVRLVDVHMVAAVGDGIRETDAVQDLLFGQAMRRLDDPSLADAERRRRSRQ